MDNYGIIQTVSGHVVQVKFLSQKPKVHELLSFPDDSSIVLEVLHSLNEDIMYCISLS